MSLRPISRVRCSICILPLVLLALSWGYFYISFSREFQTIEQQANRHVSNLALGLEEHTGRILQVLDLFLLDLAKHLHDEQPEQLESVFGDWLDWIPELEALLIVEPENALILASTARGQLPENLEFLPIKVARQNFSKLQIDNRLYQGSEGEKLISLIRQLSTSGRKLQVIALVRIDHLLDFHHNFQLGPNGSVAILHELGMLLARMPVGNNLIGRSFADGPLFTRHLKEASVGLSEAPQTTDGVRRIVAHRKMQDYPLVVTVGTSLDGVFDDWKARLLNVLYIQLAVSAAIFLSIALLIRTLAKMEQAEVKLGEREEHFRSLADSTVDAVISVGEDEKIQFWSTGAEQIFGSPKEEALGMPISCFLQFESNGQPLTLRRLSEAWMTWPQRRTFEIQGQRKGGQNFPTELSVSSGTAAGQPFHTLIVRDATERKQLEERIRRLASHDNLTQLPNRGLLMDRLTVAMAQVRRQGGQFALLFLDLDEFKPVNDTHGHDVGDQLLQQVAERLQAAVRESDTVARVGGDEFALLLNNVEDNASVSQACKNILEVLSREFRIKEVKAVISCSVGAIVFNGQELNGNELIGLADMAMYRAKRSGKNRFEIAASDDHKTPE